MSSFLENLKSLKRTILLGVLAIASVCSLYWQIKANENYPVVIPSGTTYYTPGQNNTCKWVIHISNEITTFPGDNSSAQIGIPEVIENGYISGIIQNGPGLSLLLAFKLPTQSDSTPPIILTAIYEIKDLPIRQIRFRVFNSTVLTMVIYDTQSACVEAAMK